MWDNLICPLCDRPMETFEWLKDGVAHEDYLCGLPNHVTDWGEFEVRCIACVREQDLPRCEECHIRWADGAIVEQDDVITFI